MAKYNDSSTVPIDMSTATTATLVTGVAGKKIRVLGMALFAGGASDVTLKDNTTALHGKYGLAANGGLVDNGNRDCPVFVLTAGNDLKITSSAAVQVSGRVTYDLV